jgi:AcrR family transcriptional regulator
MILGVDTLSTPTGQADTILDALLKVVAEHGLEKATVREVAAAAGVAIGTVQHYFPTKDNMMSAAFAEVVRRIATRVQAIPLGGNVHANLTAVMQELLPLDDRRRREVRIQLAFAAKAATTPALATLQRTVLDDVRRSVATAFGAAWTQPADSHRCSLAAAAVLAAVDGLALHAISADLDPKQGQLVAALDLILTAVLDTPADPMGGRSSVSRTAEAARWADDAGSPAIGRAGALL